MPLHSTLLLYPNRNDTLGLGPGARGVLDLGLMVLMLGDMSEGSRDQQQAD